MQVASTHYLLHDVINSISSYYSTWSVNCIQVLTQILARLVCVHVSVTRMKLMHVGITCVMYICSTQNRCIFRAIRQMVDLSSCENEDSCVIIAISMF